ncbi:MAG: serine/threonine protein kinase [Planctomycetes bacterium]|nr:serine/threonine protein kinase [Planctomycetota bacterium]
MADTPDDSQIRRLVVESSLVTREELREAAERQRQAVAEGRHRLIGEVMVDLGFLTRTQLNRIQGNSEDSGGRPAQQIPGYQLQKKIGAGAMAVVYKAKQISLDRTVAVKVLPKRLSRNAEFVERFYREGKAAAALNHNNIVQAIDVGEAGGYHYFVMEYVEGNTVYDELTSAKVYNETEAIAIIRQVAEALLHAHERGIIHRDVKPKNIMLTRNHVAKLADMGLARAASDVEAAMTEAGRAYGTPYYISPEQIRGEVNVDHRADIYSLGATSFHMLTGRVPFEGPTPSAVMHKHLKEPLTPPDHLNTQVTAGLAACVEKMMAKSREERYPSCKELLYDLDLLAGGEPPYYAEQSLGHDVFATLAQGEAQQIGQARAAASDWHGLPLAVTVVLGLLLALSVLGNIILGVALAS